MAGFGEVLGGESKVSNGAKPRNTRNILGPKGLSTRLSLSMD